MEEMTVKTPSASTKIFLGEDCLAARLPALTEGQSNFVLTDSNVYALYAPLFQRYFADAAICVVEAGEQYFLFYAYLFHIIILIFIFVLS